MKSRLRSIWALMLAFVLAMVMFLRVPLDAVEAAMPVYLKEVVTSAASSAYDAKSWLTQNGYEVVDSDLNEGTGFDYVYLGYKTTRNKNEAITDISLMDMNGGYTVMDYASFAEKNSSNISVMTQRLQNAASEMRANLQKGSRAAEIALEYLNVFTVPEASAKLGDWLIDAGRTENDFKRVLLIANSLVVNVIYTYLSLGCVDTSSFAELLSEAGPDVTPRNDDTTEYWETKESENYSRARELYRVITSYVADYDSAEAARLAGDGSITVDNATEESADAAIREFAETGRAEEASSEAAFVLSAYAYLQEFSYTARSEISGDSLVPQSEKLGDFFVEIGHMSETDETISLLYPLAEALSDGQFAMLTVQGVTTFASFMAMDAENLESLHSSLADYSNDLYEALGTQTASVWIGANTELFDTKIALTEKAIRQAAAANDLGTLTEVTDFDLNVKVALSYIGGAAMAAGGVALIASGMGAFVFHGIAATFAAGILTITGGISATVTGIVFGVVGVIGLTVAVLAIAALLVLALIIVVNYVSDLIDYFFPDYTDIPKIMYEKTKNGYVEYHAVNGKDGKPGDVNGFDGSKWNALYYTTDTRAGNPITADENGKMFKVAKGSYSTPTGYLPVSRMGENTAFNLNTDTYLDLCDGIYLYYCADPKESDGDEGTYLEELVMYSDEDAKVVKDRLYIEGYSILDYNLTSDSDYATFIGYRTTNVEKEAIRDIRVSWCSGGATAYWGSVSETYGLAGSTDVTITEDTTDIHLSLYYTKGASFGTPILVQDFGVVCSLSDIPTGCEGVNLFCGGRAFDFNTYDEEDSDTWKKHAYVYFRPSVEYTSGTEYVSGITFVSGSTDMDPSNVKDFVKEMDLTILSEDICKGFLNDEDRTYLCYSKTYNPYRAITDIGVFTGEFNAESLLDNSVLDGVGYMSAQVFTQGDRSYYDNILWGGYYRLIRPDHAYITNNEDYGGEDEYGDTMVTKRALYVSGPTSGKEPITVDGLACSNNKNLSEGYIGVHDMTDVYETEPINLAMYDSEHKNAVYLSYKGTAKVRETYISSIQVVYSEEEDCSYNTCLYSLMASGGGEFIKVNLAQPEIEDMWLCYGSATNDEDPDWDDYEDGCAYIRVTRTKTKNDAIGSVILYRVGENDPKPAKTLKLPYDAAGNTATFICAGDRIKYDEKYYYLYYSKTGTKISEFTVDTLPFTTGSVTVLDQNRKIPTDLGHFFKTKAGTPLPYIEKVMVASGKVGEDTKVVDTLIKSGCTEVEPYPVGDYGGKRCVYLGYSRTTSTAKALKNIIVSIGTNPGDTAEYGGVTYTRCGGNLNSGVSGAPSVYLYATTEGNKTKALTDFAVGSVVPSAEAYGEGYRWEYAHTLEGERADLTRDLYEIIEGGCDEDDKTTHTEHYLYLHHKDNACYSDDGMLASVFAENATLLIIAILGALPVLGGGVVLLVRRKKGKAITEDK